MGSRVSEAERAAIAAFAGPVKTCPDGQAHGAITQSIWRMTPAEFDEWYNERWRDVGDQPITPQMMIAAAWRNRFVKKQAA